MTEIKGFYLTLHGPDGSGKTTVGRKLVSLLSQEQPAVFFDDWRKEAGPNPFSGVISKERMRLDNKTFMAGQLAKIAFDSLEIDELNDQGIIVVKDRGVRDVRAEFVWRGMNPDYLRTDTVKEPDFSVALTLTEATRQQRLTTKVDLNAGDLVPNVPGSQMYAREQHVLSELAMHQYGLVLPTDTLNSDEVTGAIYDWLQLVRTQDTGQPAGQVDH